MATEAEALDKVVAASPRELTVAVAGFGAIGSVLARKLDAGIPGLRLAVYGEGSFRPDLE